MPVSPARPKGPPLNALRAFESAARLGGFAAAADELCVTSGAISQHIRTLEDWTGMPLFDRRSHGVRLTAEGRRLLPEFSKAFDAMGGAVRALRDVSPDRVVTIAALPAIAQLWLQPRLGQFRAALPDVNLSVVVVETPPNLERDLYDLSLFMRDPKTCATGLLLAHDRLTPVCAPSVAKSLTNPSDLADATLLHDEVWSNDWARWAQSSGVSLSHPERGPRFSLYSMAVEEAKAGAGVLIGHSALLGLACEAGTLVAPFAASLSAPDAFIADIATGPFETQIRAVLERLAE